MRRSSVLGPWSKTLMPGAIHLSPADQIKGSPAGPTVPLGSAAKERWEHLLGPHGQSNHVTVHGRGGTAKRERFAVYGEAKDVELVPTRWSCTSKIYRQGPRVYPGALSCIKKTTR